MGQILAAHSFFLFFCYFCLLQCICRLTKYIIFTTCLADMHPRCQSLRSRACRELSNFIWALFDMFLILFCRFFQFFFKFVYLFRFQLIYYQEMSIMNLKIPKKVKTKTFNKIHTKTFKKIKTKTLHKKNKTFCNLNQLQDLLLYTRKYNK